jgi:hypothetical protein
MGDSTRVIRATACRRNWPSGHPDAAEAMLPKLRVMLIALVVASAVAIMASATLLGIRDPGNRVADVPDLSRTLVRRAIVEVPDRQHLQMLAYTRRADELVRLRDLPTAPARAVVEYAERAQATALEPANAPAALPLAAPVETMSAEAGPVAPASEPAAIASLAVPPEPATEAPATVPAESAAKSEAVAPAATSEPASAVEQRDARLATAESASGEIAAVELPGEHVAEPKPHHAKSVRMHRKTPRLAPASGIPPSASSRFPIDPPQASRATDLLLNARLRADP